MLFYDERDRTKVAAGSISPRHSRKKIMNTSGIFITADHLKSLAKKDQDFLFDILTGRKNTLPEPTVSHTTSQEADVEDEHFAELSPKQARDFYSGCGTSTRKAIDVIARSDSKYFQLADVAKETETAPSDLSGVWGGLTRRVKTITGDSDAYLIDWTKSDAVCDEEGNYIDHKGEVTEMTYRSFRKALGLQ